jgi:formylglycine-generating enzyme required for sulfatase activity
MKWIPAGSFTMGSPAGEEGREEDEVQHRVTLTKGFWLMEHEVTQGEWEAVMGENPVATGTRYSDKELGACDHVGVGPNLPVACVSWEQAVEFAQRASARDGVTYRLPTEAEWEYAARGGQAGAWAGAAQEELCLVGNVPNTNQAAAYESMNLFPYDWHTSNCDDGYAGAAPVGSFHPNGYGLYDMIGNVWEWVSDCLDAYPVESGIDPIGPSSGSYRVIRGGGWSGSVHSARVANRGGNTPARRDLELGLRLARTGP